LPQLLNGRWTRIHAQPGRAAYRVETVEGVHFVKHYHPGGWAQRLRDFVVRRKFQGGLAFAASLGAKGLGVARPIVGYVWGGPVPREALAVYAWLDDARHWLTFLGARPGTTPPVWAERRRLVAEAGVAVATLHREGLYHGDLMKNLFVARGADGRDHIAVIDLDDLRMHLSRFRRIKNIEELGRALLDRRLLPTTDRLRFLRAYLAVAGLPKESVRSLWREATRATALRLGQST
jgi:hypothetical protein